MSRLDLDHWKKTLNISPKSGVEALLAFFIERVQKIRGKKPTKQSNFAREIASHPEAFREVQQPPTEREKTLARHREHINNSESPQIIQAVKFLFAAILGWGVATMYAQYDPKSSLQEYTSDVVRSISQEKTGYQMIGERDEMMVTIRDLEERIQSAVERNSLLREENDMLREKNRILQQLSDIVDAIANKDGFDIIIQSIRERKKKEEETKKTSYEDPYLDATKVFSTAKGVIATIQGNFTGRDVELRIQEQKGGKVVVWAEHKGKKLPGFIATSAVNSYLLQERTMITWVEQTLFIEQVQDLAKKHNKIGLSKDEDISMKFEKHQNGTVIVKMYEKSSKKSARFTLSMNAQEGEIRQALDEAANSLLPSLPVE